MVTLAKLTSKNPIARRAALAACYLAFIFGGAPTVRCEPRVYLGEADEQIKLIQKEGVCTSASCQAGLKATIDHQTRFVAAEDAVSKKLDEKKNVPLNGSADDKREYFRNIGTAALNLASRMKTDTDNFAKAIAEHKSEDADYKAVFKDKNAPIHKIIGKYRQVIKTHVATANDTFELGRRIGTDEENLKSFPGADTAKTTPKADSSSALWTAAGIGAGSIIAAGAAYFVGKELVKEAGKEADRVVDRTLDKAEERVKKILDDSTKTVDEFIKSQIAQLKEEVKGLTKEALQELEDEVLSAYDKLIEKAKKDGDALLFGKLEKARVEIKKFFDDLLKGAGDELTDTLKEGVGDFIAGKSDELLGTSAIDTKLAPLAGQLATFKAAGKTGDELLNACRASGANLLGKSIGTVTSEELAKINAICAK